MCDVKSKTVKIARKELFSNAEDNNFKCNLLILENHIPLSFVP